MNNDRITFVIPAYNAADTLAEAVASIFVGNFEAGDAVSIVNDGSTDTTKEVMQRLQTQYPQAITLIHNEVNKGCPATRNIGISQATTALIFNLDADNILAPHSIPVLREALRAQRADMVAFADYHYFVASPHRITHYWHCVPGVCTLAQLFAGHINPGPGGNFLYTKASWERIGGYWEYGKGLHEAWGFTLKQLANGSSLYVVPGTYYFHRHGHDSLFVTESKNKPGERELLYKMVSPYQHMFTEASWQRIISEPTWYQTLDSHPLELSGLPMGKNGTLQVTWYGRLWSLLRKLQSLAV